ncbi:MAG: GPW/gp25 family protein [Polyangiaceae bacterium]
MKGLSFPFRIDRTGRTATVEPEAEVRELIEQVLFVAPGERVMRPTFGSGAGQLVFAPAGEQLAATTQHLVQGALQTWLGDRISVETVSVSAEDSVLTVAIRYRLRGAAESQTVVVSGQV